MSRLVVEVGGIEKILPHPNADRLEIVHVKGWQCVVQKDMYTLGQSVVYFPPDTLIPESLADALGVKNYLQFGKDSPGYGRIRCAKLRGEPSFGLLIPVPENLGEQDPAIFFDAKRYEPPVKFSAGDAEKPHILFVEYTEIENLRNFPDMFMSGEDVYITEKIDGTNVRVGIIDGELMAGSHRLRRKQSAGCMYWMPLSLESVKELLSAYAATHRQVILFGEVFGRGVQSLQYGKKEATFAAFDLLLDGKYLAAHEFFAVCSGLGIPTAPVLAHIAYGEDVVHRLASGKSTISGASHIREGVVVRPVYERTDPRVGRVIGKYKSDEYLLGQKEDYTDV